ncbi:MAG: type II secretion system protein [Verrucomicrobia bacterium]|nr:type II secretion system protein [Verrucomicrobiota bacterium]
MSRPRHRSFRARAFTLAEVLAALLFMAIVIPVAMHGVSVSSRAGNLGQRKAAAARIAERVLEEQMITNQVTGTTPYGTITEGDFTYPWTLRTEPWVADTTTSLLVVTVRVEFELQGHTYDIAVSSLHDPAAPSSSGTTSSATTSPAAAEP